MGVLQGKSVVVTGAGRGLGRAYALDAARNGASVVVNDVDTEAASRVVEEIVDAGGTAVVSAHSVATWENAGEIVGLALRSFGRLDGLVNNAGVIDIGKPWDATEEKARACVEVNLLGAIFVGTHAMQVLVEQGSGSIVNATSSAQIGISGMGIYGATKGALASLTYSWAIDLEARGVRVNAFSPVAETAMSLLGDVPVGQLPTPEDNAPAVTYLLSDLSTGITGQVIQRRGPALMVMGHPAFTTYTAESERWAVEDVAERFGPVLSAHQQQVGFAPPQRVTPSGGGEQARDQ